MASQEPCFSTVLDLKASGARMSKDFNQLGKETSGKKGDVKRMPGDGCHSRHRDTC